MCEGACVELENGHSGTDKTVHVKDDDSGYDWGNFIYCDNAIKIDRERGLTVEVLDEKE